MNIRQAFLFGIAVSAFALVTTVFGGQEPIKCKSQGKGERMPKYKMGLTFRSKDGLNGPSVLVIQVSIESKHINRTDLLMLASQFKKDFCKEQRFAVVLLTDHRFAKAFPVEGTLWYEEWQEALRGEYFLDRNTGEEYISYSTVPNYGKNPQSKVKIELDSIPSKKQPQPHQ